MSYFGPFAAVPIDSVIYKSKGSGGGVVGATGDIPNGSIIDPDGGASIVDPTDGTIYIVDPAV